MNIEKELKKNGITVINKLDTLSVNTLAKNIAQKLCRAFPNQHFICPKIIYNYFKNSYVLCRNARRFS